MLKAVLDTNVLVSGLIKRWRGGIPDQIIRQADKFQLCLSEEILEDTHRVLHYPRIQKKYHLSEERIEEYLNDLRSIIFFVKDVPFLDVIKDDPDDNMVLACAVKANADYIVSGDPHLKKLEQYRGIKIVSPRKFLKILEELHHSR